jgi:hypothetical protein
MMGYAFVMLKMVVLGEKLFILLEMHLIHANHTAIFYVMEQLYLTEAEFPMEQMWSYLQKFK